MANGAHPTVLTTREALTYHLKKKAEGLGSAYVPYVGCFATSPVHEIQKLLTDDHFLLASIKLLMATQDPPKDKPISSPTGIKTNVAVFNNRRDMAADSDSDYEHRSIYHLKSEKLPHEALKFILTIWYSPEISSMLVQYMSSSFTEVEIEQLLNCPLKEISVKARRYFEEMNL